MNGIAKKSAANSAGTTYPSVQILLHYEVTGYYAPDDREAIIRKGLWEWLLASKKGTEILASEQDNTRYETFHTQEIHNGKELVILMANLIGGDTYGPDRENQCITYQSKGNSLY